MQSQSVNQIWEVISSVLLSEYTIPALSFFVVLGLFRIGAMVSTIKSILVKME